MEPVIAVGEDTACTGATGPKEEEDSKTMAVEKENDDDDDRKRTVHDADPQEALTKEEKRALKKRRKKERKEKQEQIITAEKAAAGVANESAPPTGASSSPLVADEASNSNIETAKKRRKRKRKRKHKDPSNEDDDDNNTPPPKTAETQDTDQSSSHQAKCDTVHRTVYVEGIPFDCTPDDVRAFFEQHMPGLSSSVVELRLPTWHDSGRLKGYGHVVFSSEPQYQAALQLSGQYLHNRYLTIVAANAPKVVTSSVVDPEQNPSCTLILHNLSYQATEEDIQMVMNEYGTIPEGGVRVVRHSDVNHRRSKGFGYVTYDHVDSAKRAVSAATVSILGRPVRLDYDHGRVRGSFRTADRRLWQKEYGRDKKQSQTALKNK